MLGFNFIGLAYLLVYVGAVSILFLFILMLINVRISELLSETNNGIPIAIFSCFLFGFPMHNILVTEMDLGDASFNADFISDGYSNQQEKHPHYEIRQEEDISDKIDSVLGLQKTQEDLAIFDSNLNVNELNINNDGLYYATSSNWDNNMIEYIDITSIGHVLYTTHGIWLLISSVILLLSMIGAITITKKEKD